MFKILGKDSLVYGLILGLFAPLLGMVGFYFYRFSRLTPWEFIQYLGIEQKLITSMVSFSLLANAILFTIFINRHTDKTAKGIFMVTCIYAIAVLVLKYWFV
jgi:hypothetical protein